MKKGLCLLFMLLLLLTTGAALAEDVVLLPQEVMENEWYQNKNAKLKAGNPTPLTGRFFTTMWGGNTSDLDVQELLHAYSPIRWDAELGRFRFDRSVVEDALISTDETGNRTYLIVLTDNLLWSDGSQITARDYAFSLLLQMSPAVAETGGTPVDCSWLEGCDEYLNGDAKTLSGFRLISDNILQITMKAESLPYFYELNRLNILPYPIAEIAPGAQVRDDGEGVYLTQPLTADLLREYVLDEKLGYLTHPRVVSGPYVLAGYDGTTATFAINPLYKGNEEGMLPRIGEIEYTTAENGNMIKRLSDGRLDLLNKVTMAEPIRKGIELVRSDPESFSMENTTRTGLTLIWFMETSPIAGEEAVRKAIAYCFDRDGFIQEYTGNYGLKTDGYYGLGQWMYRIASGQAEPPVFLPENPTEEEENAYDAALAAWKDITLDGLTLYQNNTEEAIRLLEEAGWNLNENGEPFDRAKDSVRYKKNGEELTRLTLTLAMPESAEARTALEKYLVNRLRGAGMTIKVKTVSMDALLDAYEGRTDSLADMIYLGDNFSVAFDPDIFAPHADGTELSAVKEELYALALDMVRTQPDDLIGFERKWVKLQERITETLPLLPVYTNVYFDFSSRRLHNYQITKAMGWGEAIVSAYMSDAEEMDEAEQEKILQELDETGTETE